MTSPMEPITQLDLMGYADGRLDPARRREVERLLARHPELYTLVKSMVTQNDAIREAHGELLDEPVPARLISVLNDARPPARRWPRAAAVVALALAAATAGWWGGRLPGASPPDDVNQFVDAAANAHLAGPDGAGQPMSRWAISANARPLEWLADRVTLELRAPSLAARGYRPIDNALVEIDGRPTVRLTFERDDGEAVSLFLRTRWRESPPTFNVRAEAPQPSVYWFDGPLMWVLTGTPTATELSALAEAIQETIRLQPGQTEHEPVQNALDIDAQTAEPVVRP